MGGFPALIWEWDVPERNVAGDAAFLLNLQSWEWAAPAGNR